MLFSEPETTIADPEQDQAALTAKSQGSSIPGELESSQQVKVPLPCTNITCHSGEL